VLHEDCTTYGCIVITSPREPCRLKLKQQGH